MGRVQAVVCGRCTDTVRHDSVARSFPLQILDDQAAAKLLEAIARQAHRDAAGLDSAPATVQVEARHWLAAWQGCGPDSVRVRPKVGRGRQPARAKSLAC